MKKSGKRILSLILALCLTVCVLSVSAVANVDIPKSGGSFGKTAAVNPDYIDYIKNGGESKNGLVPDTKDLSYLAKSYAKQQSRLSPKTAVPSSYDMRDYGYAPATIDQGQYGICWAIQSTSVLESTLIRQNPLISFSANHLAWFSYIGNKESEAYNFKADLLGDIDPYNSGGYGSTALGTLAAWKGPVSTAVMPQPDTKVSEKLRYRSEYHVQDSICPGGSLITDGRWVSQATVSLVKQLMLEEKTAVGIDYYNDDFYYNPQTAAFYCDEPNYTNHSVIIIGWDDNYSKENFRENLRPEHDGAWLVKNSWGESFGENGVFWLSYEDVNIKYSNTYTIEEADNYENNYQYDVGGWMMSVSADAFADEKYASKQGYMANIFTANGDEQIEAVSFYTTDANSSYDISIYTGVSENEPTSGKIALKSQSGTEFYCGYHTIELQSPVKLKAGERYSVVVKLTNPEYAYPIATEASFFPYSTENLKYFAKGGESFISVDGKDWCDAANIRENQFDCYIRVSNVCLKAFTNPIPSSGANAPRVRFSVPEGQIAVGDTVQLLGNGDIYYTVTDKNGVTGEAVKYTEPIVINDECTVAAWIKDGGKDGEVNENKYTVAKSQLIEMFVEQSGNIRLINLQDGDAELTVDDNEYGEPIKIMPHGAGIITVNGKTVKSDEWSQEIVLNPAVENKITVVSSEEGKAPTAYTINVLARALKFDYTAKTVSFDDTIVSVEDPDGNSIENGGSIEKYITESGAEHIYLTVTHLDSGIQTTEPVAQKKVLNNKMAYLYTDIETTVNFSAAYIYADNEEMINARSFNNAAITVTPGQTLYIQRTQDSNYLESNVYKTVIPERPETPTAEIVKVSADTIKLKYIKGAEYRIRGGYWQDSCVFSDIDVGADYTFEVRVKATDNTFASNIATVDYSGESVQYVLVVYRNSADNTPYYRESVPIFEGKNTIRPNKTLADDGYFKLAAANQSAVVNLTEQNGELVADTDVVYFDVIPSVNPSDYYYRAAYFDRSGNKIGEAEVPYSYAGITLIAEMPVPEGYRVYDTESNYANTALTPYFGKWYGVFQNQMIIVEKTAQVSVNFIDQNGAALPEYAYTEYIGEVGDFEITPKLPDGYIAADGKKYYVAVTRDDNDELTADISEITVKIVSADSVVYGDADGNCAINMLDVLLIRKYIAKQPVSLNITACDVTHDNVINMLDVLKIRKYIAKQPVDLAAQAAA